MNIVPEEAWPGMSCNVSHLRVFGCVAYAHVLKKIRGKLDDQSEKCIFIGYSEQSKAYKLYNPVTRRKSLADMLCSKNKSRGMGL